MEETNPIPAAPYNRGRGSDFIWEHYTFYKAKEENKKTLDEVRCIYCEGIMLRHAPRCKEHITGQCPKASEEIRSAVLAKWGGRPATRSAKKRRTNRDYSDDSGSEDDDSSTLNEIQQLTRVLTKPTSGGSRKSTDSASALVELISGVLKTEKKKRVKPLEDFTDDELAREERILKVKEARLRVQQMEAQAEAFELLPQFARSASDVFDKLSTALDIYINKNEELEEQPVMQHHHVSEHDLNAGDHNVGNTMAETVTFQVETAYSNGQGDMGNPNDDELGGTGFLTMTKDH